VLRAVVFSERELYMLSPVRLSSVCNALAPTQAVVIFRNISTALGTLAILESTEYFTEIVPGEPLRRGS